MFSPLFLLIYIVYDELIYVLEYHLINLIKYFKEYCTVVLLFIQR